jgi:hypothetical protein
MNLRSIVLENRLSYLFFFLIILLLAIYSSHIG